MGKYTALQRWLSEVEDDGGELSFGQLADVIGSELPESARRYPAFWAERSSHLGRLLSDVGWRGSLSTSTETVRFQRRDSGRIAPMTDQAGPGDSEDWPPPPDLVLLGCVKTKLEGRHAAKDLYRSSLFEGRRRRAEQTRAPWYVLSALYGLVGPDDEIDTYDVSMQRLSGAERRAWADKVLSQIDERVGAVNGLTVEIHAGEEYRSSGVERGLGERGAIVSVPLRGVRLGQQLAWYRGAGDAVESVARAAPEPRSPQRQARGVRSAAPLAIAEARAVAGQLTGEFRDGKFDLSGRDGAPVPGWDAMPEFRAVRALKARGADGQAIRRLLTLGGAMDRARDADRLWDAVAEFHEQCPWAFAREPAYAAGLDRLRHQLAESGVSQRHGPDSDAWIRILEALDDDGAPESVRAAVEQGEGDSQRLLRDVRAADGHGRPWYPLLRGPKISVLWVRMLAEPGGATISGLASLPVAVDTQVRKVSEYLGISDTDGLPLDSARQIIQGDWASLQANAVGPPSLAGTAAALDPAIWFFGKWGCTRCESAGTQLPISGLCGGCRAEF